MNFGYAQTVPTMTSFSTLVQPALLQHVRAHHQVRVPVAAGIRQVGADAADLGREMEDALGPRLGEQPLGLVPVRQVEVALPRREDVVPLRLEPLDEVPAEKAPAAGDEGFHRCV